MWVRMCSGVSLLSPSGFNSSGEVRCTELGLEEANSFYWFRDSLSRGWLDLCDQETDSRHSTGASFVHHVHPRPLGPTVWSWGEIRSLRNNSGEYRWSPDLEALSSKPYMHNTPYHTSNYTMNREHYFSHYTSYRKP